MITQIKIKGLLLFATAIMILPASCKKDKTPVEIKSTVPAPDPFKETKTYLPEKLTSGKSTISFNYSATLAITEIDYGNGDRVAVRYDAKGYPVILSRYKNNVITSAVDYFLNKEGQLIKAEMITILNETSSITGYYTVKYNTDNQPVTISYYDNNDKLLREQKNIFSSSGNLTSEENGSKIISSYDYDTKNGLFKNAGYTWLFILEKENPLLLSSINNVKEQTDRLNAVNSKKFSYAYNQDGYPETITTTINSVTSTTKIAYKK